VQSTPYKWWYPPESLKLGSQPPQRSSQLEFQKAIICWMPSGDILWVPSTEVVGVFVGLTRSIHSIRLSPKQVAVNIFKAQSTEEVLKKDCSSCGGAQYIKCPTCSGTGRDKKGGNVFERWKCMKCQGFGYVGCPECKGEGLTPEQRGER